MILILRPRCAPLPAAGPCRDQAINGRVIAVDEASGIVQVSAITGAGVINMQTLAFALTIEQLAVRMVSTRIANHPIYKDAMYEGHIELGQMTGAG